MPWIVWSLIVRTTCKYQRSARALRAWVEKRTNQPLIRGVHHSMAKRRQDPNIALVKWPPTRRLLTIERLHSTQHWEEYWMGHASVWAVARVTQSWRKSGSRDFSKTVRLYSTLSLASSICNWSEEDRWRAVSTEKHLSASLLDFAFHEATFANCRARVSRLSTSILGRCTSILGRPTRSSVNSSRSLVNAPRSSSWNLDSWSWNGIGKVWNGYVILLDIHRIF